GDDIRPDRCCFRFRHAGPGDQHIGTEPTSGHQDRHEVQPGGHGCDHDSRAYPPQEFTQTARTFRCFLPGDEVSVLPKTSYSGRRDLWRHDWLTGRRAARRSASVCSRVPEVSSSKTSRRCSSSTTISAMSRLSTPRASSWYEPKSPVTISAVP